MHYDKEYYEEPTENPQFVIEVSDQVIHNRILTVVGAGWPVRFKNEFPDSSVYSFDSNSYQIAKFLRDTREVTGNVPIQMSVTSNKFEKAIQQLGVNFLFLSNISDYIDPDEADELGEVISKSKVRSVLFSTLGVELRSSEKSQSTHSLAESLQAGRFKIARLNDSSNYEINTFYLAGR